MKWEVYDYENNIVLKCEIHSDTVTYYHFFKNKRLRGKTIEVNYYELIYEEWYCENGQVIVKMRYNELPLNFKYYFCNGNIEKEFSMVVDGVFRGSFKEWYENGQIKIDGYYNDNNREDKVWKYFCKMVY